MLNEDSDLPVYSSRENLHVREESREYSSRESSRVESSVYKRLQNIILKVREELREEETDTLALRVPKYVKVAYASLTRELKRRFKEVFIATLLGFIEQAPSRPEPVVVNVVINEAKAEAKAEDPSRLLERLAFLEEDVKFYKAKLREREEMLKFYKERCERLQRDLERLRSAARRRDWTSVMRLLGV